MLDIFWVRARRGLERAVARAALAIYLLVKRRLLSIKAAPVRGRQPHLANVRHAADQPADLQSTGDAASMAAEDPTSDLKVDSTGAVVANWGHWRLRDGDVETMSRIERDPGFT